MTGELVECPRALNVIQNGGVLFAHDARVYRAAERMLICPCHQSTFDVLTGAKPVFGPAGRLLPQLPIHLDPDGTFVADGDFPEPVGPSFWNMTS